MEVLGCYDTYSLEIDEDKLKLNLENIGTEVEEAGKSLIVTLNTKIFEITCNWDRVFFAILLFLQLGPGLFC